VPVDFAEYNQVLPGAADRILTYSELEADHRRRIENFELTSVWVAHFLGMAVTFLIAVSSIGGGIWLASRGNDASGIATIVTAIAALSGMFFWQNRKR